MVASGTLWFEDSKAYEDRLKDGAGDDQDASSQGQSYARGGQAVPNPGEASFIRIQDSLV